MKIRFALMTSSLFLLGLPAQAGPRLELHARAQTELNALEREAAERVLSEVEAMLPPALATEVLAVTAIDFQKFDDRGRIVPPLCPVELREGKQGAKASVGARLIPEGRKAGRSFRLVLNRDFLPILVAGPDQAAPYACGHRNLYRLAQASIIHELAHVYDFLNLPARQDARERQARLDCEAERLNPSPACRALLDIRTTLSQRREFLQLAQWASSRGGELGENKNREILRSPDAYELADPQEGLAVNFEFFVLDPEFKCRRPSWHRFFAEHFSFHPYPNFPCETTRQVRLSTRLLPMTLDPARAYEIHYLLADKGTDLSSRWGHSMFRIVQCGPRAERPEVGPDCLRDIAQHLVVSFRASVQSTKIDHWAGLTGKYDSRLFLFSLPEILEEYTVAENRQLLSIPLRLSREEVRNFVERTLEQYWEYRGQYYFLGNNCATESLQFLQAVTREPELKELTSPVTMPQAIRRQLKDLGRTDESGLRSPEAVGRYVFPSLLSTVAQSFAELQSLTPALQRLGIEDYLTRLSPAERRQIYLDLKQSGAGAGRRVAARFNALEYRAQEIIQARLRVRFNELVAAPEPVGAELAEIIDRIIGIYQKTDPLAITQGGYGIPLPGEIVADDARFNAYLNDLALASSRGLAILREREAATYGDLADIEKNIQFFSAEHRLELKSPGREHVVPAPTFNNPLIP